MTAPDQSDMKNRRATLSRLLWIVLLVSSTSTASGQVPLNPTDGVYKTGEWTYQIVLLGRGTTDEKTVGKLSYKGKEVIGREFARLRSEIGEFMWAGLDCGQSRLGWYRIDPRKKYARWVMVHIDQSQQGPYWKTKLDNE